ncbi:hypothetical protein [Mycobacteroides abscessus]|uniref:hypothetical protein n=1 Tax=Mycobacteroides abscessus TaxID=36809 RepID=UPI0009CD52BC|nr:hypothetical protein [Mycobacteroides abscessus]SLJ09536.1 Uncharacterised protein [Mycobacteroides abscessus subsp. abscessus]
MNSLIDAGSGMFLSWEGNPHPPVDTFTAAIEGVTLAYEGGRLTTVTGDDIDPSEVVVWDRRARQLAGGDFTADTSTTATTQYTPEFLQRVATAHTRGGNAAVQKEFDVSRRQAARYIARARESGLIAR